MADQLNKVLVEGNLTADAVTKDYDGKRKTTFTLGVNSSYKDKNGQYVNEAQFVPCERWGLSDKQLEYLKKGNAIKVEGEIKSESWADAEGKKHSKVYVSVANLDFTKTKSQEKKNPEQEATLDR